ncbi:MAG: hypothetical protein Q8J78_06740 [Moraxellaceae bacterium]|nr:hypothetical protein [Moraxellaceae bacterium]
MSPVPSTPQTTVTSPCVCCRSVQHNSVPDRDLDGYVCFTCAVQLRFAELILMGYGARAGIAGCTKEKS